MKVSTQKNIGRNLRTLRNHNSLSQNDMAEAAGLTRSTYVQYELGNRTPDAEALYDVAMCFGLAMEMFFEEDTEKFIGALAFARECSEGESKLVDNYSKLSPFFKGMLLEKSHQLLEWNKSRQSCLDNMRNALSAD